MPTVPRAKGPQVALGVTPDARMSMPNVSVPDVQLPTQTVSSSKLSSPQLATPQFKPVVKDPDAITRVRLSDRGAAQQAQMGQDLSGVGDTLGRAVEQMQLRVNATVVDDAITQAREAARKLTFGTDDGHGGLTGGYRNLKGYDAIKRPGDKALDAEVSEAFDKQVKEIAKAKIANPDQRYAFEAQVKNLGEQLRQGVMSYHAEQFETYHTSVYKGMVAERTQGFAMQDPADMAGQREGMHEIEGAVATLAAQQGASAQELEVGLRSARGAAVGGLFERVMAEKKYGVAQALLNEWGDKIDPNTSVKMKLSLDGKVSIQVGEQLADEAWRGWAQPAFEATNVDRAFNIVVDLESKGSQVDKDGKVIRSPKGAFGAAQLMPDTAAEVAKSLGRPELADLAKQPTREGEAANRLLGQTYFKQMLTKFKGDVPKALAAYNAGPGALLGGKDSRGNKIEGALVQAANKGGDWRDFLPAETKDYVANGMRQYGAGAGAPPKPKKSDLMAQIDARTDDPDVRRAAYSRLDQRFTAADYDEREGYESAYSEGLTTVRESGGNINAVSPELRARIKPDQLATLQTYAKNLADGQYTITKPEAYYVGMAAAISPATTVNQIEALRPDLSEQDFKTVQTAWLSRNTPTAGNTPADLDVSTLDSLVKTRLQSLGVNTSPKQGDTAGQARLGAVSQFVHQYVLQQQRQTGKKFTEYGDLEKIVNTLFLKEQGFRNVVMGVTTGHGKATVLTSTAKDIPSDTRKNLETQLQTKLGHKPSEAELLQAYFRVQFYDNQRGD